MNFPLNKLTSALPLILFLATVVVAIGCTEATLDYPTPEFVESEDCEHINKDALQTQSVEISDSQAQITVMAEIAIQPSDRSQGMMCRQSIPDGTGMLFVYESDQSGSFWMKNTYVPIDIFYIDRSGVLTDKITMSPCLRDGLSNSDWDVKCATEAVEYSPKSEYLYALELPAGWLSSEGFDDIAAGTIKFNADAIR